MSVATRTRPRRLPKARPLGRMLVLVVVVWLLWPAAHGGRLGLVVVNGNSMQPTYAPGEVVMTWRLPVEPGTPVLLRVPAGHSAAGTLVIHRIRDRDAGGWITQGDNSSAPDGWRLTDEDVLGRAVLRIRGAGALLRRALDPLWLGGLAGLLIVASTWPESRRTAEAAPEVDQAERRRRRRHWLGPDRGSRQEAESCDTDVAAQLTESRDGVAAQDPAGTAQPGRDEPGAGRGGTPDRRDDDGRHRPTDHRDAHRVGRRRSRARRRASRRRRRHERRIVLGRVATSARHHRL